MKITIYELLGLIKDGKAPKKIKWNDVNWEYINLEMDYRSLKSADLFFYDEWRITTHLFDEVEIIEEQDKLMPKHLTDEFIQSLNGEIGAGDIKHIAHKINEIINYLQHIQKEN